MLLAGEIDSKLMEGLLASIAHDKGFAFFNPYNRNEKKAEVVVHALIISLIQSANRASTGILIQNLNFGCNTGDEDHVNKYVYIWG